MPASQLCGGGRECIEPQTGLALAGGGPVAGEAFAEDGPYVAVEIRFPRRRLHAQHGGSG